MPSPAHAAAASPTAGECLKLCPEIYGATMTLVITIQVTD
jgi:hypothetical protein